VSNQNNRLIFIPPVVPPTPPSTIGVGNIVKETSACGPLQQVVREPVRGTFFGLFANSSVPQGFNDRLTPYIDARGEQVDYRKVPMADGGYRMYGHQVIQYTTVIGVGSGRNLAIGGGGGGGGWAQGGGGTTGSMQQMVTSIQLRECEVGSYVPPPREIVYVESKRIRQ